jgi:eukaryotic-like serine/threonine-protein kinase
MAEVFRAVMPGAQGFKQTLVVKRIIADRAHTSDFVDMFVQEARIGALLNHPNIVQVFDFGTVGDDYFLAMEYLRGHDVLAVMKKLHGQGRVFPVPVATFVAHEVAACLGYAHALTSADGKRLNVVHRDVSPSNIMCLRTGGVKLLDFGIAKVFGEADVEHTQNGLFKGKLAYVPPERIKNAPLDGRGDLFALGVVLWEMLAGRRLFRGKNELETLTNVMEKVVPPPSSLNPDVPASLDRIVMQAIERDPDARYQTGQDMADDLDDVLRETKYSGKMLPDLIRALFGVGSSSQAAMSALTPELLATLVDPDEHPPTASASVIPVIRPHSSGRFGRVVVGLAAVAVVAAALGGFVMSRRGWSGWPTWDWGDLSRSVLSPPPQPIAPTVDPLPVPTPTPVMPAAVEPMPPAPEAAVGDAAAAGEKTEPARRAKRHKRR